jgi:hypothetical protein
VWAGSRVSPQRSRTITLPAVRVKMSTADQSCARPAGGRLACRPGHRKRDADKHQVLCGDANPVTLAAAGGSVTTVPVPPPPSEVRRKLAAL